jgi:hypothetical protein
MTHARVQPRYAALQTEGLGRSLEGVDHQTEL